MVESMVTIANYGLPTVKPTLAMVTMSKRKVNHGQPVIISQGQVATHRAHKKSDQTEWMSTDLRFRLADG